MRCKKSLKRSLVAVALTISVLVANLFPNIAYADASDSSDSLLRMQQLGILDSNIVDSSAYVTRGQFARAIVEVNSWKDIALAMMGSTVYPDIDSNSESSGYVNLLKDKGLMYGMSDGYFHEELPITYAETITTLVKLLGYSDSDVTGTWPNNYLSKASDLKLTKDISLRKNGKVTAAILGKMFERLLDTDIKSTNANGSGTTLSKAKGLYADYIILETSRTSKQLSSNTIITDKGTLYLSEEIGNVEIGVTFRLKVDSTNKVEKVFGKIKDTSSIILDRNVENTVYYRDVNGTNSMILPSNITYYSHGIVKNYSDVKSLLKTDSKIIFSYNTNRSAYEYAVIIDPVYSDPQIATNMNSKSIGVGDIYFIEGTPIIKNGQVISKNDIEDMDVVYNLTDIDANNSYILVYNSKIEGNIKTFVLNGATLSGITIDNNSYNFDNSMDLSKLESFKTGDLVSLSLGYDNKVVDINKISYKTGTLTEITVLGNNKTNDNLIDSQVLVDTGTGSGVKYSVGKDAGALEVGEKYKVYINGNTINKAIEKTSSVEKYIVKSISGESITATDEINNVITMNLPKIANYYYHGVKKEYNSIISSIQPFTSIVLQKNIDTNEYDSAVILDPYFSRPYVYDLADTAMNQSIEKSKYLYMYKNGVFSDGTNNLYQGDVFYLVSDIWNKNTYIYASDSSVYGAFNSKDKANPTTIKIGNTEYELSQYFDKTLLYKYYSAKNVSYVKVYLDINGKVFDIK